jgi:hydrogenase maturation protease
MERSAVGTILVIGYGNIMRSDDAAGVHAAHRLEEKYRGSAEVRVIAAHQLTPELAEDIANAHYVLFLDAAGGTSPGQISELAVKPNGVLGAFDHQVTPGALVCCAEQLYGEAPSAFALTLTGTSFGVGTSMSLAVTRKMQEFVGRAVALIESWLGVDPAREPVIRVTVR